MLKENEGFHGFVLMKNDGIVIRWENMDYAEALHYAANVLSLTEKTKMFVNDLLEPGEVRGVPLKSSVVLNPLSSRTTSSRSG